MSVDKTQIVVRRGAPGDVSALVEFNLAMARETENRALDRATVRCGVQALFDGRGDGFYQVAQVQERETAPVVVGALMVTYEWSDWRDGWFWWIQSVYVRPDYRRQGVFRMLFESVRRAAQKRPEVCGLRLYVEQENASAQRTYEALSMTKSPYFMYEIEL